MIRQKSKTVIINALTFFIRAYQNTISLLLAPTCRYSPSCSQYAIDALNKYGIVRGLFRSGKRVLRCHPFSNHNGYDPA